MGMLEDALRQYAKFADRAAAPSTPATDQALLYVEGGQLKLKDDGGAVTTFGAGGGGGGGELLGFAKYSPASLGSYTTTSHTPVDLDATNLAVTFTVPASGRVIVRMSAYVDGSGGTGNNAIAFALREGTSAVAGSIAIARRRDTEGTGSRCNVPVLIEGLTASAGLTWKWAWLVNGTMTGRVLVTDDAESNLIGPALMEVWAA